MAGYQIRSKFELGYRNKEDISTLPPETLVVGSQNVLTNAAEQVGIRQGYVLDGDAGNQNDYGVDSAYDFQSQSGTKNLRKWGLTLDTRYENPVTAVVSWIALLSNLLPLNKVRFTSFWDYTTEKKLQCLFVNGDNNVYEWSGGIASVASVSNAAGIIGAVQTIPGTDPAKSSGGSSYTVGDVLTISGGDGTATLEVLSVSNGAVVGATLTTGGSGYAVNDIVELVNAASGVKAAIKVLSLGGGNSIATFSIFTTGIGYTAGSTFTTLALTGAGSGATITVTSTSYAISAWQLLTNGTGYVAADNVALSGGTGTGATVSITNVGTSSIVVSGDQTLSQLGFYDAASNATKFKLLINGITYTYLASNGNGGMTFVGITPDPTLVTINAGDAVIQLPFQTTAKSVTSLPTGFNFDLIATSGNQVYYGDLLNNTIYISKANDYKDVTFSSPRIPGEGALATLDSPPVGFKPQSIQGGINPSVMYIAAGNDQWYSVGFNLSADLVNESINIQRLKTTARQGAQSQELIADFKNTITFVSNEPQLNEFGVQPNFYAEPQMVNISDSIKFDMDAYDFEGGAVDYDNYYLYVLIPADTVVRMFNIAKKYWEAPQILPVSRFYRVEGILYGHSSLTNESYQLFTGYNDNGNPINAIAAFPYVAAVPNIGEVDDLKTFDRIYTEGYIAGNTTLLVTINYDFGGFTGTYNKEISGQAPANTIFNKITDGSLGQSSLGTQPVGSILNLGSQPNIPKFRIINTMPKRDSFESQIVYSSNDVDQQWTLLRFGTRTQRSVNLPTAITQ